MKTRAFEFRMRRVRGIPSMLAFILGGMLLVGVIALVLMVGVAVVTCGLVISAGAALYYAVRRKLTSPPTQPIESQFSDNSSSNLVVRQIEVEVLPSKDP
jgi:hypothetical protein